ncbi:ubiquitin carboxyl-terminal hydrolase mindy-1 [Plakobranchus ocellatus]|uniref:Ubiquitin carboxyl-terminal hydrolase n=1 Tax=Plakobranchus ocellatus TaxID=259542 RepID=A0AAV4CI40_9GAST|nr:ubiquitin carboxyl-terminal hydrolase mindy-1 [Plakobranchus ocellatus]
MEDKDKKLTQQNESQVLKGRDQAEVEAEDGNVAEEVEQGNSSTESNRVSPGDTASKESVLSTGSVNMDQQTDQDKPESDASAIQNIDKSHETKESADLNPEKPEHAKNPAAESLLPAAEDSGCLLEEGIAKEASASQHPGEDEHSSSGESSPVSSSQDPDSGVSPDEATSEPGDEQMPETRIVSNVTEDKESLKEKEASLPGATKSRLISDHKMSSEEETKTQLVSPSGHASPEGSAGLSETQVTVSDLDSPLSPTLQGGATSVAEASGATASAMAVSAAAAEASCSSLSKEQKDLESVYYIKWITFDGGNVPIITQNENGPCPLLALVNVLLLKGKVKLAPMLEMITSEQLMTYLGECILENAPKNLPETTQANYEQNMQDAMSVMHKLQTGLDVNVKFTGVREFEYTPELIVFDLLGIALFHGWLVDPQDRHTVEAVNQCSYNQLVEKIISLKHSDKEEMVTQALTAEQFLERSASQLTYHGLAELSSVVKENELCVFFRNNHFNTLYRHNSELFLLVTDQGFLTESQVVWETLSNVEGDCHFTDATFRTYTKPVPSSEPILPDPNVAVGSPEQIDHDYQVALFLQEEASAATAGPVWATGFPQDQMPSVQADHDLALRLQEEENRREALQAQHAAGPAQPAGYQYPHQQQWARQPHQQQAAEAGGQRRRPERREREDKSCTIL